jgi:hypothetical protein
VVCLYRQRQQRASCSRLEQRSATHELLPARIAFYQNFSPATASNQKFILKILKFTIMKMNTLKSGKIALALVIALTLGLSAAKANDEVKPKSTIELKVVANVNDQPVLLLSLNNQEEEEFQVTIKDQAGNIFYSDKVKGTMITKKFMINSNEIGDDAVYVEVKSKKSNKVEVYNVARNRTYIQETTVSRIN